MGMTIRKIIDGLYFTIGMILFNPLTGESKTPDQLNEDDRTTYDACMGAIALLKEQEPVEPHYTRLEYMVNGMPYVVHHPECPRCIENGLILWDAEIERGAAYCKRCGQAVKWE